MRPAVNNLLRRLNTRLCIRGEYRIVIVYTRHIFITFPILSGYWYILYNIIGYNTFRLY